MPAPSAIPGEIPNKLYFRIGEVAQIAGVEPYVLRFWETEFAQLKAKKSGTGHRLYRRKEVEMILEVKRLLKEKRFTIEGAKLYLEQQKRRGGIKAPPPPKKSGSTPLQADLFSVSPQVLEEIRSELAGILRMLK